MRNGMLRQIDSQDLVIGDVVFVRPGDKIPADMIIFNAVDFKVNNSSLTGESEPLDRFPANNVRDYLQATNICFNGTIVETGEAYCVVIRTGDETVLGTIASTVSKSSYSRPSPLSEEISRLCKIITFVSMLSAFIFFFVSLARWHDLHDALVFAIGILVAWVPQGLSATVTMLLSISALRMSEQNVLVKNLLGVETLGSITLLATDKTGTLTRNQMSVNYVWINGTSHCAVIKEFKDGDEAVEPQLKMSIPGVEEIMQLFIVCSRAHFDRLDIPMNERQIIGDATEVGLLRYSASRYPDTDKTIDLIPKAFEVPFTSASKIHITVVRKAGIGSHFTMFIKGAPEQILPLCSAIMMDGEQKMLTENHRQSYAEATETYASKGYRVLGLARLELSDVDFPSTFTFLRNPANYPTDGYTLLGLVSLQDPPKHGVRETIGNLRTAGIKVFMVTGDSPITAESISRRINLIVGETKPSLARKTGRDVSEIDDFEVTAEIITGEQLELLSDSDWDRLFGRDEVVFARTTPKQKLEIVKRAQASGHIVGVTGDGVNDSPALQRADLGISMNITGSDVSKQVAEMILLDDNFSSIFRAVTEGRLIFLNLKKSIQYALTHIMAEVVPYFLFVLLPMPVALTSAQVLLVDLGFELFAPFSFAFDPPESVELLMTLKPRIPVTENSIARRRRVTDLQRRQGLLPPIGEDADSEGEDDEKFKVVSRWKRYYYELNQMRYYEYWRQLFSPPPGGEILIDAELVLWSYLEGGLIECVGCLITYFVVMAASGLDISTVIAMQRRDISYFTPKSPPIVNGRNETITGDIQYDALKQAQSSYYLSILIIQAWNLFACKSKLKFSIGSHVLRNNKTWYSLICGAIFGAIVVYTPLCNKIFLTSNNLNAVYLTIPMSFGAVLYVYATLRRVYLLKYHETKRVPTVPNLIMYPSTMSLDTETK